jgi:hypothetical protein
MMVVDSSILIGFRSRHGNTVVACNGKELLIFFFFFFSGSLFSQRGGDDGFFLCRYCFTYFDCFTFFTPFFTEFLASSSSSASATVTAPRGGAEATPSELARVGDHHLPGERRRRGQGPVVDEQE